MKSTVLWALAALNVLLAAIVVGRLLPEQQAHAQAGGRPSDYIMVPATVTGITTGVVFIVDTSKGELSGMTYNDVNDRLEPMPKIDLAQVFKAGQGVGAAGGGNKVKPR